MYKIITGGCSFTRNEGSWAHHIPDVINVARGGSGPVTSIREVLVKLRETAGDKICIFQVSNPSRKEIIINKENQLMFSRYDPKKGYDTNLCGTSYYQIKGFGGTTTIDKTYKKAIETFVTYISEEQRAVESYEMLTLLQLYCKYNNIPLLMFYGWLDKDDLEGELIQKVLQGIDWTMWWKQGNETMSSWLLENGHKDKKGIPLDGQNKIRPTLEGHKHFYDEIIKPWITSQSKSNLQQNVP
tara:strand:- start:663 stop:1388 length:726 start_codon:yes stop_codon:yes gene_type:complete